MTRQRFKARLQGGPFDGKRAILRTDAALPPQRVWVLKCDTCPGIHYRTKPHPKGEMYRRDIEEGEVWLYVFTDDRLGGETETEERELAPAGASSATGGMEPAPAGGGRC